MYPKSQIWEIAWHVLNKIKLDETEHRGQKGDINLFR